MEMNKDPLLIKKITRILSVEAIKQQIILVYARYHQIFGHQFTSEALNTFDYEVDENNKHLCELIIESGFYLYFLLEDFVHLKSIDNVLEIQQEIEQINHKHEKLSKLRKMSRSSIGLFFTFIFRII